MSQRDFCFTSMIGWNFWNERYKIQTMQILFSQPPLLIFIKGANISGGHSISDFFFHYADLLHNKLFY